jgi:O-methyltransferase involved in polyketide biosynthesis
VDSDVELIHLNNNPLGNIMEYLNAALAFSLVTMMVAFISAPVVMYFQAKDHDNFLTFMASRRTGQPMIFKLADELALAKLRAKNRPHSSWAANEVIQKELQLKEYIKVNGSL